MKQRTLQSVALTGVMMLAMIIVACADKKSFSFKTSNEAIAACRTELYKIKDLKNADMEHISKTMAVWIELQDSAISCFMRDSTAYDNRELSTAYYAVVDSFKTEILRLTFSQPRTLQDVVKLKVATSYNRNEILASKDYKTASEFFAKMDSEPLYPNLEKTLFEYEKLLTDTMPLKKEQQLYDFIQKEDRCFRSLLLFLKDCPQEKLQLITDKTSDLFDALYNNSVANPGNAVSERVKLYLTMRFNRRIIQNAEVCRNDIKKNIRLSNKQTVNYRWMLIQPFMTIDNYAMASMTEQQIKTLSVIAEELPELLCYIDGKDYQNSPKEETEKLTGILTDYFLKSYLKSII